MITIPHDKVTPGWWIVGYCNGSSCIAEVCNYEQDNGFAVWFVGDDRGYSVEDTTFLAGPFTPEELIQVIELSETYSRTFLSMAESKAVNLYVENKRLRELLKDSEWVCVDEYEDYFCHICGDHKRDGHADDCKLKATLKDN